MSKERHPSDSSEQRAAQKEILSIFNKTNNLNLKSNFLQFDDIVFQVDGYFAEPPILCEIYSRIGAMRVAQNNKISKDILKMLLIDKLSGKQHRKMLIFADEEAASSFSQGESWYSKVKDYFDIEIIVIDIPKELRESLLAAQKRQYR